jgi:hypothetical protein
LREELTDPSSRPKSVIAVTSAFGVALLSSFQNIEKRRRAFEASSTAEELGRVIVKKTFPFLPARRPALFGRMREAMWLLSLRRSSEKPWR